jgi:type IV secretory pathway protease TraF
MFVIVSKHEAFGRLYLGRHHPVVKKVSALKFRTAEAAQDRIDFWKGLLAKGEPLDPKFFENMEIEEA